jgi:hypothetical protein
MKDFVSNQRARIVGWAACVSVLWALFVVPGGQPWTGLVWLAALGFLFISSVVLLLDVARRPSPAPVVRALDDRAIGRKS